MSTTRPPSDSPTTSFDNLPRLTSWQRSRLVRSTRKLAKILGETPVPQIAVPSPKSLPPRNKSREIIQEYPRSPIIGLTKKLARTAFEPIQVALRREPDGDSVGARSERACAGTASRGRDQSPVLFFEAPNIAAPVNSHSCYISQVSSNCPSPIEPSFRRRRSSLGSISNPHLILSPTECEVVCEEERDVRSRRRRLSKLTRHLGEGVPPELILSNITYSKPTSNTNTPTFIPPVVSNPSRVHTVALPVEQGTPFSPTTLSTPFSKFPQHAVVRKVDSFVGSIGRSLSHRFHTDVTSPRLLAQRLRRSRSETTLSQSHEHLTPLRTDTHFAPDDHLDTPIDGILGQQFPLRDQSHP